MNQLAVDKLNLMMNQAREALDGATNHLEDAGHLSTHLADFSEDDSIDRAQILQLILQYRLDSQDALAKLLKFDNGLLQILGIAKHQSPQMNLERMEYALGNDDLHNILYALSQLVSTLIKIAHRYQRQLEKASQQRKKLLAQKTPPVLIKLRNSLQKTLAQQKHFITLIAQINLHIANDEWIKLQSVGPLYDHIGALRGPVSQFFQAIQNGMTMGREIYETISSNIKLNETLDHVLKEANNILQHLPDTPAPQHFFHPAALHPQEDQSLRLEERASNKRLGNFFNH
jgi:hypothetical protein